MKLENIFNEGISIGNLKTRFPCDGFCMEFGKCGCREIDRIEIDSINIESISNHFYMKNIKVSSDINSLRRNRLEKIRTLLYGGKLVDLYSINRIFNYYKLWNVNKWGISIEKLMYGEEIKHFYIKDFNDISNNIETILSIKDLSKRVENLLSLENKELVINSSYIKDINFNDILIDKNEIELKKRDFYKNIDSKSIMGIVRKIGDKYSIVDGHHRISSNSDKNFLKLIIINS